VAVNPHATAPPPPVSTITDSSSYLYYNGTISGNGGIQTVNVPAPSNGTVWDLVSAKITISASSDVGSSQVSYLYDSVCTATDVSPAPSACTLIYGANVDAIANDIMDPGKDGTISGGGGYSASAPSGISYWVHFEQTIHLNHDMFISFGADLSSRVSSSYYLVFDPEAGDYPSFAFYRWGNPVESLSSTAKTITVSGPPAGYYYRAEIAVSTIELASLPGPTRSAEVVEEPSGTVLSLIDHWTVDATGLTEDACGGYSSAQTCTTDPVGTATVWDNQILVTSGESLEARFVGVAGDLGVFAVILTEYPAAPTAPTGLVASSPTTSSLTWSWTNPGGALTNDLLFWEAGSVCSSPTEIDLGTVADSHVLSSLASGTEYCAYVEAVSAGGTSSPSATATGTTTPSSAPAPPTDVSAAAESSSEVLVTWTNPGGVVTDDYLDEYSGSGCTGTPVAVDVGSVVSSYDFDNLSAGTTYSYEVAAANSVGEGSWSGCANATTDTAPPSAPTNLSANAVSSSSIDLLWTNPPGSVTDDFVYTYAGTGCTGLGVSTDLGAVEESYASDGLNGSTTYSYEVEAANSAGAGPNSLCTSATTENGSGGGDQNNTTVLELTATTANGSAAPGVLAQVDIQLLPQVLSITLGPTNESGNATFYDLPAGTTIANVTLIGENYSLNSYTVTSPGTGVVQLLLIVTATPPNGNNTTAGYWVQFTEQGLPTGATWWVSVAGPVSERFNCSGTTISFDLENGTYQFTVGAYSDLNASQPEGTLVVPNAPASLAVNFTSQPAATSAPPSSGTGLVPISVAPGVTIGVVAALLVLMGALMLGSYRSARRHPEKVLRHASAARRELLRVGDREALDRLDRTVKILREWESISPPQGYAERSIHGRLLKVTRWVGERPTASARWVRGRYSAATRWVRARR
jgi:hypothetical protein